MFVQGAEKWDVFSKAVAVSSEFQQEKDGRDLIKGLEKETWS